MVPQVLPFSSFTACASAYTALPRGGLDARSGTGAGTGTRTRTRTRTRVHISVVEKFDDDHPQGHLCSIESPTRRSDPDPARHVRRGGAQNELRTRPQAPA